MIDSSNATTSDVARQTATLRVEITGSPAVFISESKDAENMNQVELQKMKEVTADDLKEYLLEIDNNSEVGLIIEQEFTEGFTQIKVGDIIVEEEEPRWNESFISGPGKIFKVIITSEVELSGDKLWPDLSLAQTATNEDFATVVRKGLNECASEYHLSGSSIWSFKELFPDLEIEVIELGDSPQSEQEQNIGRRRVVNDVTFSTNPS